MNEEIYFNESLFISQSVLNESEVLEIASSIDYYVQGFAILCLVSMILYCITFYKLYKSKQTNKIENILFIVNFFIIMGAYIFLRNKFTMFINGF